MILRAFLITAFIATGMTAGCGGNDNGSTGGGSAAAGQGGQTGNCEMDFAKKTAEPFTAGMKATATDGSVTVALESSPPVPTLGDHSTWTLTVTDASGAPVAAGTKVSMQCLMTHTTIPSHGCPATIKVKEMGNGVYEASPVIFNMPGHWEVSATVDATVATFELCVE
jgi:hypothetical protein